MQKARFVMMQLIQNKPEKILSSQSYHLVNKQVFSIKLLHAIVQCACNVKTKYQVNPSKAVVVVDRPMYALM